MKRILVAVDGTDMSRTVLARAVELARAIGGTLRLLNVVMIHPEVPPPGAIAMHAPAAEAVTQAALAKLLALEELVPTDFRGGVSVELGGAADTICRFAKDYDADIVVIGAHRHGAIARLLGTTAARVTNRIDRPVLVVRPDPDAKTTDATPAVEAPAGARPNEHTMLEATTLTGAAVGALLGAIGGPPGAVAGGAIGTAVGMLAGVALDQDEAVHSKRDKSLDDAIGVTSGDLGEQEIARASFDRLEKGVEPSDDLGKASAALRKQHEHVEEACRAMVSAYESGDWNEVRKQFDRMEPVLVAHMDFEERSVFPSFLALDPEETSALKAEHEELRHRLAEVGLAIDLHAVPRADLDAMLARIREHATREAYLLYPWMDDSLDPKKVAPAA